MITPKKSAVSDSDDDTVDMEKERKDASSSDDEDAHDRSKKRKIPIKSKRAPVKFSLQTPLATAKRAKVTPASRSKVHRHFGIYIRIQRLFASCAPCLTTYYCRCFSHFKGDTVENKVVYIDSVAAAKHDGNCTILVDWILTCTSDGIEIAHVCGKGLPK